MPRITFTICLLICALSARAAHAEDGTLSTVAGLQVDSAAEADGLPTDGPRWVGKPRRFVDPAVYARRASTLPEDQITSSKFGLRGLPAGLHDDYRFAVFMGVLSGVAVLGGGLIVIAFLADPRHAPLKLAEVLFGLAAVPGVAGTIASMRVEANRDPAYFPPPRGTGERVALRWGPTGLALRF